MALFGKISNSEPEEIEETSTEHTDEQSPEPDCIFSTEGDIDCATSAPLSNTVDHFHCDVNSFNENNLGVTEFVCIKNENGIEGEQHTPSIKKELQFDEQAFFSKNEEYEMNVCCENPLEIKNELNELQEEIEIKDEIEDKIIEDKNEGELEQSDGKLAVGNVCAYKTIYQAALKSHLARHTGVKPFTCNQCDYKTITSCNLKQHQRIHSGEKPYACNLCNYKSTTSGNLKRHKMRHSGDKPFACNLCDFKTTTSSSLKEHKMRHTGEKPFSCNLCDYKTARSGYLKQHKMKH